MVNFNETVLDTSMSFGIKIDKQSVTWSDNVGLYVTDRHKMCFNNETCLLFPDQGFFKRETERSVLPHAVGCQSPSHNSDYMSILKGIL